MVDSSWVLALMLILQPEAPWKSTYQSSAEAIASAAQKHSVFDGPDGEARTAAWLVSLAYFEGSFKQDAAGDCHEKFDNGLGFSGTKIIKI